MSRSFPFREVYWPAILIGCHYAVRSPAADSLPLLQTSPLPLRETASSVKTAVTPPPRAPKVTASRRERLEASGASTDRTFELVKVHTFAGCISLVQRTLLELSTSPSGSAYKSSIRRQYDNVSEIEFRTLHVVAERWTLGCMLRFVRANNDYSDTLMICPQCRRAVS
jgi:hypothetical protein